MWESESLNYPRYFCNWLSCLITNVSAQPIYSGPDFPRLSSAALAGNVFCFQGQNRGGEREDKLTFSMHVLVLKKMEINGLKDSFKVFYQ